MQSTYETLVDRLDADFTQLHLQDVQVVAGMSFELWTGLPKELESKFEDADPRMVEPYLQHIVVLPVRQVLVARMSIAGEMFSSKNKEPRTELQGAFVGQAIYWFRHLTTVCGRVAETGDLQKVQRVAMKMLKAAGFPYRVVRFSTNETLIEGWTNPSDPDMPERVTA